MRRLAASAAFVLALATFSGCASLFTPVRDRAIDACRAQAQEEGWRIRSVEAVRREGTAQRVEMRAVKSPFPTTTVVCYFDPSTGEARI